MQDLVAALSPRPVLLVRGAADELAPVEDARLMFQADGPPRPLLVIPGGNQHLSDHQQQAVEVTLEWLRRYFKIPEVLALRFRI